MNTMNKNFKNAIKSSNNRIDKAEDIICKLEYRTFEIMLSEENKDEEKE